jgi:hypothetical protein
MQTTRIQQMTTGIPSDPKMFQAKGGARILQPRDVIGRPVLSFTVVGVS